jgi:hypothetical protein
MITALGGSEIYLGKKNELYTRIYCILWCFADGTYSATGTPRYTLSNMTVELTKDLTDSVYGGVISGEGQVIKTGTGIWHLVVLILIPEQLMCRKVPWP